MPTGRLRFDGLPSQDRNYAVWTHLSPLIAFFVIGPFALIAPLVLWLTRREHSSFLDDHGREVVNFSITGAIVTLLAVIPIIGWIGAPIWFIVAFINVVRGSIAAGEGECFRYPMTIRFLQ
jgi:uncharacterized Tic20 family protein